MPLSLAERLLGFSAFSRAEGTIGFFVSTLHEPVRARLAKACLTRLSSSEWKLMIAAVAPADKIRGSASRSLSRFCISMLTAMRRLWNVLVAG